MTTELLTQNKELAERLSELKTTKSPKDLLQGLKQQERIDKILVILLDTSSSMGDHMETMSKIDISWRVFQEELIPSMMGWTYGVVMFGDDAWWDILPTNDTRALSMHQPHACGSTAMGKALQIAWAWVKSYANQARFILLTDGQANDMRKEDILGMAKMNSSIPIDTIGIGKGGYDYDPEFLKGLSTITGGVFAEVDSIKLLSESIKKLSPSERPLLGTVREG